MKWSIYVSTCSFLTANGGRVKSPFKTFTRPLFISSHHPSLSPFTWAYFFKFGQIRADIRLMMPIIRVRRASGSICSLPGQVSP